MYYMKNLGINQNEKGLRIERVYREPLDCEPHSRHSLSVNAIERQENDLTADRHREHIGLPLLSGVVVPLGPATVRETITDTAISPGIAVARCTRTRNHRASAMRS